MRPAQERPSQILKSTLPLLLPASRYLCPSTTSSKSNVLSMPTLSLSASPAAPRSRRGRAEIAPRSRRDRAEAAPRSRLGALEVRQLHGVAFLHVANQLGMLQLLLGDL